MFESAGFVGLGSVGTMMEEWDDLVLVGRVVRTHGLRGDLVVQPETDFVAERFRVGAELWTRAGSRGEVLTIAAVRIQRDRPVVVFEGYESISAAEGLVGRELRVAESTLHPLGQGQYYGHQLVGCVVETMGGDEVGAVARVDSGAGGSRLVVRGARGEILIPLAAGICREVDPAARRIRIDPPVGLLELNESKRKSR